MARTNFTYESLRNKYMDFTYPLAKILVGGSDIAENKEGFQVSELTVELSSGFEASAATFRIYNCFDVDNRVYQFDKLKKYICLGFAVSVSLGYSGVMTEVFRGFIAQVNFASWDQDAHHVEVVAMDVKGMMMANAYARQISAVSYGEAVKEIFDKAAYQKMKSMEIYTDLKVTDTPDKGRSQNEVSAETIEMVSESDYEFVVRAARHFNYEFFVDVGEVRFRKSKEGAECLVGLGPDDGLLHYEITYDITGLVQLVEVRGTDHSRGGVFTASRKLTGKLSKGNKAKQLISQTKRVYVDASVTSAEQAQARADSLAEEISDRLGKISAECVGLPELKPGCYVETKGLGGPADNRFYITQVKHTLTDSDGFHTSLTGRAPSVEPGQ